MDAVETMAAVGDTWHGKGNTLETEVNADEMIDASGLNWEVELKDLYLAMKAGDGSTILGDMIESKAVVRMSDNKKLGTVGPGYHPIQNKDMFKFVEAVVGAGQALYHTAGSLFDGKRVFITLKLPEKLTIGDDEITKYLLVASSHDGSLSFIAKQTPVRVVCNNTLSVALWRDETKISETVKLKHTKNFKSHVDTARKMLKMTDIYYQHVKQDFERLLEINVSFNQMHKMVENLFPVKPDEDGTVKIPKQTQKNRELVESLYHNGIGNESYQGTGWAAFNAVTEFTSNHRKTRITEGNNENDLKFNSLNFGPGAAMNQQAFNELMALDVNRTTVTV